MHRLIVAGKEIRCASFEIWTDNRCQKCEAGLQPNMRGDRCVPCPAGYAGTAGSCYMCAEGKVSSETGTNCEVCSAGSQPTKFANGSAATACGTCPAGSAGSNGYCAACGDGRQPNIESTSCENCGENRVSMNGAPCEPCERLNPISSAQCSIGLDVTKSLT